MENKQNMKKEKIKDWSYWAVITLLLIGIIANIAYTISYFTDSITARMTITFTKLDATLSYNSQTYTNDFTIDAGTLTTGSLLFSIPLSVSADEGSSAFIRVSAEYKPKASTSQEDISQAQAMCTVLNLNNSFTPYTNGTSYKWDQIGRFYYLTDLSDDLISVSFGSSYVFFGFGCSPIFPDTSTFDLENTDLTNVEFCVTAQAIQSSTTIEDDIENVMNYAFTTTSEASEYGYFIQYEENGGRNIYNTVVPKGSSITLPTVSNLSVYWRDASDDSSVGVSGDRVTFTSNKTLYAVYSLGKVTVYFEDPYVDSALLPQTAMVTPGGSVNVGATLTRAGYVYTQWTNGTLDLTVSANTITIPNSVPVNSILILHPKWSLVNYTATFVTGGQYLTDDTGYIYDNVTQSYSKTYTVEDVFVFPEAEHNNKAFVGWLIQSCANDGRWRINDTYVIGQLYAGYFGNVTFEVQWADLIFNQDGLTNNTMVKVYKDNNFTVQLTNKTSGTPSYSSTNTTVATVDSNGEVTVCNVGTTNIVASVTVAGITSTAQYTLEVIPRALSLAVVSAISNQTYTASAITPAFVVTDTGDTLVLNTDYTISSYSNNTNVGQATITLAGIGNYDSTLNAYFQIVAKSLSSATITLGPSLTYNGSQQTQTVTSVVVDGRTLTYGTDYTLSGNSATNAGGYTLTVTGLGNYTSTATQSYTINKTANTLNVSGRALTYDGSAQTLVVATNAQGDVYYSIGTPLTGGNYSTSGSTTLPTRVDAGTYTIYYYTTGNTNYSPTSGSVQTTIGANTLGTVSTLAWSTTNRGTATWGAVSAVTGITITYYVQLYKNGVASGDASTTTGLTYNYATIMRSAGAGTYTFKVTAKSNNTSNCNHGNQSTSSDSAYVCTISVASGTGISSVYINSSGTSSYNMINGEVASLGANLSVGYENASWSSSASSETTLTTSSVTFKATSVNTSAITLTASATLIKYAINFSAGDYIDAIFVADTNSATSGYSSGTTFDYGTTVYVIILIQASTAQYTYSAPAGYTNSSGRYYYKAYTITGTTNVGVVNATRTLNSYALTFSAGTGISNIFSSVTSSDTSGNPSGTLYDYGTTVYVIVQISTADVQYTYGGPTGYTNSSGRYYYYAYTINGTTAVGTVNATCTTNQYAITFSAGNYVSSIFVSTASNATSGDPSGTVYDYGTIVYVIVQVNASDAQYSYGAPDNYTNSSGRYYYRAYTITGTTAVGIVSATRTTNQYAITFTQGDYLQDIFVSTNPNATSGDPSGGTQYDYNSTIYLIVQTNTTDAQYSYSAPTTPSGFLSASTSGYYYKEYTITSAIAVGTVSAVRTIRSYAITFTKGTGLTSIFVSGENSATSGSASGTEYDYGSVVYVIVLVTDDTAQYTYTGPSGYTNRTSTRYYYHMYTITTTTELGTVNANSSVQQYALTFTAGSYITNIFSSTNVDATAGNASSTTYPYGTVVYLIALTTTNSAQYSYTISGWTSRGSNYFYYTYTMNSNKSAGTVNATRTTNQYTITFAAGSYISSIFSSTNSGATGGSASGATAYDYGSTVYVIAQVNADTTTTTYYVNGWTNRGSRYYYKAYTIGVSNAVGTVSGTSATRYYTLTVSIANNSSSSRYITISTLDCNTYQEWSGNMSSMIDLTTESGASRTDNCGSYTYNTRVYCYVFPHFSSSTTVSGLTYVTQYKSGSGGLVPLYVAKYYVDMTSNSTVSITFS